MTHHDDDQLAAWLADGPHHGPVGVLGDALARAREPGNGRVGWSAPRAARSRSLATRCCGTRWWR